MKRVYMGPKRFGNSTVRRESERLKESEPRLAHRDTRLRSDAQLELDIAFHFLLTQG
jgi:hypothetical protein